MMELETDGQNQVIKKSSCVDCPKPGAYSPSQIKMFGHACQRKWGFRYISKLPEPEQTFQVLGKDLHRLNEIYLFDGSEPEDPSTKAAKLFEAGRHALPYPSELHLTEQHIYLQHKGLAYHGYVDLIPHDEKEVWDFKSTSNLKYATTPEALKEDPQFLVYGKWAMNQPHRAPWDWVIGKWHYYETKEVRGKHKIVTVKATLCRNELNERFDQYVVPFAEAMRKAKNDIKDPNDLPGNLESCSAYGGCPFMGVCDAHKNKDLFSMFSKDNANPFKDKLLGAKAGSAPLEIVPTPIAEVVAEIAEDLEALEMAKLMADMEAQKIALQEKFAAMAKAKAELARIEAEETAKAEQAKREATRLENARLAEENAKARQPYQALAVGVVPPDAPPPDFSAAEDDASAEDPPSSDEDATTQEIPGRRKRGRPRKTEAPPAPAIKATPPTIIKAKKPEASPVEVVLAKDIEVVLDPTPMAEALTEGGGEYEIFVRTKAKEPDEDGGFILCINTLPLGVAHIHLRTVLEPLVAALSKQLGVVYYRLSEHAAYGKADALLMSVMRERPLDLEGHVYADAKDPDTNAVLSYLESIALQVYRGGF